MESPCLRKPNTAARFALFSACSGHFIYHIGTALISSLYPLIRLEISLTYLDLSLLVGASALTTTIIQAILGPFTDRLGAKAMIVFSMVIPLGGFLLSAGANNFWWLLIAQAIIGVGGAAYHPAGYVLIRSHYSTKLDGPMAIHSAVGLLGTASVPVMATVIAYWLSGWRSSFLVITLISLLMAVLIAKNLKNQPSDGSSQRMPQGGPVPQGSATKNPSFTIRPYIGPIIIGMLVSFSRISGFRLVSNYGSVFLVDVFGFDVLVASAILTFALYAGSAANLYGGVVANNLGKRKTLLISNSLAVPMIIWLAITSNPLAATIALLLFAVLFFLGSAAEASYMAGVTPKQGQATILGVVFSMETGVATATIVFFGWLADLWGLRTAMFAIIGIIAMGVIVANFIKPEHIIASN